MKLLKTGIAGFDEFFRGGLPPGVVLLYGMPGCGNDVFAQQVFFGRAKGGSKVTYFTTRPSEVVEGDMSVYGWKVSPLKESENWRFVDLSGAESIASLVKAEMGEGRWVIIDSLSDLLLTRDLQTVIDLLNSMSLHARKYETLHFALLTEGMHDPKVETTMQHFADGVINFTLMGEIETAPRRLFIRKMKGTIVSTRHLPFSIGEIGIIVETAIRIA